MSDALITHVAIIFKMFGEDKIYSLPRPNRHHNVIWDIVEKTGVRYVSGKQGFLDSNGCFLNRQEAMIRAKATGQLLRITGPDDMLFSEDIW